jgi:hypothetical protein
MQVIFREFGWQHQHLLASPVAMVAACIGQAIGLTWGAGQ